MSEPMSYDFVIAGGGTAGWMAAAALARFLPRGKRVALVESDAIGTVGVGEATIPQIHNLHRGFGIDEDAFIRETKASFKLGIEFDGWLCEGERYMHAFGPVGRGAGLLPFHHYWLRAKALGSGEPLANYSLNEQAARTIRMQRGDAGQPGPMPYAYHFDAGFYAQFLRRFAEQRGVTRIEGTIAEVQQDGESGAITALNLDGGRSVPGRFFIDCTGFRALLIEQTLGAGFDDWRDHLPCDRAVTVACENGGEFTPYTRAMARKAGWQWRIPLQHRIGNGLVYSSAFLDDGEAADLLLSNLDGAPHGDPRIIRFATGKRRQHWHSNCLALGLAAGFMEPLESTSIHLVQSAISRFLSVLPEGDGDPSIVSWFNAQAEFEWSRIRDFLILHYVANRREGEPFWDAMRAASLPGTLEAKLDTWRATGFIHRDHEELFTEVGWLQVLVGQGVEVSGYNPIADTLDEKDLRAFLADTERAVADRVTGMPHHIDVLANIVRPAPALETAQ